MSQNVCSIQMAAFLIYIGPSGLFVAPLDALLLM